MIYDDRCLFFGGSSGIPGVTLAFLPTSSCACFFHLMHLGNWKRGHLYDESIQNWLIRSIQSYDFEDLQSPIYKRVGAMAYGTIDVDYVDEYIMIAKHPESATICIKKICDAVHRK